MRLFPKINAILFVCAALAFAQYALAGNAPEGLLVDLLRDTDSVWRDGYPTQLKIDQLADVVELGRELPRTASGKIQRWMIEAELDQRWNALKNLGKKEEPAAPAEEAPAEEAAAEEETPEE